MSAFNDLINSYGANIFASVNFGPGSTQKVFFGPTTGTGADLTASGTISEGDPTPRGDGSRATEFGKYYSYNLALAGKTPPVDNFTIVSAFKKTSNGTYDAMVSTGSSGWVIRTEETSGKFSLIKSGVALVADTTESWISPLNQWNLVSVTYANGVIRIHANGVQVYSGTVSPVNFTTGSGTFYIGCDSDGLTPFDGNLANLAILSVPVTAPEAVAMYAAFKAPFVPSIRKRKLGTFLNSVPVASILDYGSYERAALICIGGNSNWAHFDNGWEEGWRYTLSQRYGLFSTGVIALARDTGPSSTPPFVSYSQFFSRGLGGMTPAGSGFYRYAVGDTSPPWLSASLGISTDQSSPASSTAYFDAREGLKATVHYGVFAGGGALTLTLDDDSANGSGASVNDGLYGAFATVNTSSGSGRLSVTLPPNEARTTVTNWRARSFSEFARSTGKYSAPLALGYMEIEQPGRTKGFSVSTMNARGGKGMRQFAYDLQQSSLETIAYFLDAVRNSLGPSKAIIFVMQDNQNSRNETELSVGPNPAVSNTPLGYADNCQAVISRMKEVFAFKNWSLGNVGFFQQGDHALSAPEQDLIQSYRDSLVQVAAKNPKFSSVNISQIVDAFQMARGDSVLGASFYDANGADPAHGEQTGYVYKSITPKIHDGMFDSSSSINGDTMQETQSASNVAISAQTWTEAVSIDFQKVPEQISVSVTNGSNSHLSLRLSLFAPGGVLLRRIDNSSMRANLKVGNYPVSPAGQSVFSLNVEDSVIIDSAKLEVYSSSANATSSFTISA